MMLETMDEICWLRRAEGRKGEEREGGGCEVEEKGGPRIRRVKEKEV